MRNVENENVAQCSSCYKSHMIASNVKSSRKSPKQFTSACKQDDSLRTRQSAEAALGVVLARQQFVAASRFGYFLRRCQQRLRLERIMCFGCPVGTLGMQSGSKHAKCSKVKSNHAQSSMASKVPCFISHQHLEVPNC